MRAESIQMLNWKACLIGALTLAMMVGSVQAHVSVEQAALLQGVLTPIGAERAGNADGSIPAWSGGLASTPVLRAGYYPDPFAGEAPLLRIDVGNAQKYAQYLSVGQLALLKQKPGYWMDVYPAHRSAAYPNDVYTLAGKAAITTELNSGGNGYSQAGGSPVPFPIPSNAYEVMWNHLSRWRGGSIERDMASFPVLANGNTYKIGYHESIAFNHSLDRPQNNLLLAVVLQYTAPTSLDGSAVLIWEPFDQTMRSHFVWTYTAGQKRVRRSPPINFGYQVNGLRLSDQLDGFSGAFSRYDWKLLGKQEMMIPYNAYRLLDKKRTYAQLIQPGFLQRDSTRYERHRVWVVEATLKTGVAYPYAKRRFYLDEDTWQVALEDIYDPSGGLWRHGEHHMVEYYDAKVPWYAANVWYDLKSGAYLTHGMMNEEVRPIVFNKLQEWVSYGPDALRRLGHK